MKIAILQSNYIPWKGVFDMINMVDQFVFFDDVDFTKRDWRSRNKIVTPNGDLWLTVPVVKAPRGTKIYEIKISNQENWQLNHYTNIRNNYVRAPYFKDYEFLLEDFYKNHEWVNLSEMNMYMTKRIADCLGIK
ncbi:MAG: WbqC family protein, partial [Paludibacteraceae bacterium]